MQNIVVIDDDPLICEFIRDALGSSRTVVHCATRGRSGRKLLTSIRFELAIIDLVLPDASGIALAAIAANENTPVLLVTGHPKAITRLEQYNLRDLPCLQKPFDLVRLRTETERVVAESHQGVRRIKEGMARWRASLIALDDTMAAAKQLLAVNRRLYGQSNGT